MWCRAPRDACRMLVIVAGCAAAGACAPEGRLPARPPSPRADLAAVHAVWMAGTVAPGESLAVRLVGVAGPNGSWKLAEVRREPLEGNPSGVLLSPRVARVAGDLFIQMEIPLDAVVWIPTGASRTLTVCVAGRDTNVCAQVRVQAGARRAPAAVRLTRAAAVVADGDELVPVDVQATIPSGWVAALEWADGDGPAQRLDGVPAGAGLAGRILLRRPPGDGPRRVTVQAIDGQGARSAPAVLTLPAR